MRITIGEFELPGASYPELQAKFEDISYDPNSGDQEDGEPAAVYYLAGHSEAGEGLSIGTLVFGTKYDHHGMYHWRGLLQYHAPSSEERQVVSTKFMGVEAQEGPCIHLVGEFKLSGDEASRGFFYSGPRDGSGEWVEINIPGERNTVVTGVFGTMLVCDDLKKNDKIHIYDLMNKSWHTAHSGLARKPLVRIVIPTDEEIIVGGEFEDGKQFAVAVKL